ELGPQHPVRIVLGDLATSTATRRLTLSPLSAQAVRALVGQRRFDPVVLHRQTGGNPFFVTEVLAAGGGGIPLTVREAVLARAARLSPSARAVLEAAAVIGARVEPWLLAEVTGAEASAAGECLASGMLVVQGDVLAFRHELARQTILDAILPHQRLVLNRLALDALKAAPSARRDLARLAHHAEAAGDREAVLEYAPAAARQASTAGAHRQASALYALALRFAADLPPQDHALLLELHAWECYVSGQQSQAIAGRRRAVDLWREAGNLLKEGENLAHLALALVGSEQWTEARQAGQAAVQILETLPPGRELALAYRTQALLHHFNYDYPEAIALAEKAMALAERFDDVRVLAMAYDTFGSSWLSLDYERGCEYLEKCLAIARQAGLDARVASVYGNLGSTSCELYRFSQAERYLGEGMAFTAERDLDLIRLYMLAWQAQVHLHLGRWNEAEAAAEEVLQRAGVSANSRIAALLALGRLRARRGAADSQAVLDQALELATGSGDFQHTGPVRAVRAEAAWLAGDRDQTLAEAHAVYDLAVSKRHAKLTGELAFWRWRAGDEVALPEWAASPFALHIAGNWRAAAEEWERLGCPYEQARALADGDPAAQAAALELFERLGARPAAGDLRQKMRAAGVRNIPRRPRPATRENPFGLTARQMDILALLAEELTNAEIAARLHLSPKTVDHHVSAVLAKLDVHSRAAAAELAQQNALLQKWNADLRR
ncbi:MAG: LuxR C-terminal-related transcriptional regulator, partial [Chloroflexi bacterium]|nr:LuxR C-terminal-related transcriptional regulator [Chloroflexota bacterium]MCI0647469.1 LuxR C-terminal-related transcriptional regulator [Chloroflexota bacterium]